METSIWTKEFTRYWINHELEPMIITAGKENVSAEATDTKILAQNLSYTSEHDASD